MNSHAFRALGGFALVALAMPLPGQAARGQTTAPCPVSPPKLQVYTAEVKITSVQTLADGTTITREGKQVEARDSQSRSMHSNSGFPFGVGQTHIIWVNVSDPVEGTQISWDSQSRKARVLKLPAPDQHQGCWADEAGRFRMSFGAAPVRLPAAPTAAQSSPGAVAGASARPVTMPRPTRLNQTTEDLGTATILGVEVHGHRTTVTTPVGEIGNDRPLIQTNEVWTAPGFSVPLRQVNVDPRSGTETREVVSLDLSEPPLATFQPPEGYEVVNEELHQVPCQERGNLP